MRSRLHVRIGILLDGERGRGVAQIDQQGALARADLRDEICGAAVISVKPAPGVSTRNVAVAISCGT